MPKAYLESSLLCFLGRYLVRIWVLELFAYLDGVLSPWSVAIGQNPTPPKAIAMVSGAESPSILRVCLGYL